MLENRIPRIFLWTIVAVKMTTIYDKLKQLVSINNIYIQIVQEQRINLRAAFNIEGIQQDNFDRDLGRLMGDTLSLEATEAELM